MPIVVFDVVQQQHRVLKAELELGERTGVDLNTESGVSSP